MQLKRFKLFIKTLSKEADLLRAVESFDVFRKSGANWLALDDALIEAPDQKRVFDHILSRGSHWRRRNGKSAYFPVQAFEAVVVTTTSAPTHKTTRNRIQKILEEVADHANTSFDAAYDGLTGLLNSRSLEKVIKEAVSSSVPPKTTGDAEIKPTVSIGLMALDLDHFKQINDSYGHDYGDIVLQCFAQRLEAQVNAIAQKLGGALRLEVGRSGGEEFMIVMVGDLPPERAKEIGNQIRASIADRELPAESERDSLFANRPIVSMPLPHTSERKVTVSVGLSSLKSPLSDNFLVAVTDLRREADAALYRAKAGGRNTVRTFLRFATALER